MIAYDETFCLVNDIARFTVHARSLEHPSGYGNSTLVSLSIKSFPAGFAQTRNLDVRYEPVHDAESLNDLVLDVLENDFGVERGDIEVIGESATGFRCPRCGKGDRFVSHSAQLATEVYITEDGWDYSQGKQSDCELPEDAILTCCSCGYSGSKGNFS